MDGQTVDHSIVAKLFYHIIDSNRNAHNETPLAENMAPI